MQRPSTFELGVVFLRWKDFQGGSFKSKNNFTLYDSLTHQKISGNAAGERWSLLFVSLFVERISLLLVLISTLVSSIYRRLETIGAQGFERL